MRPVKRIVLWGLSTLSTVVVLFGYHTSTSSVMATNSDSAIGSIEAEATSGTSSSGTSGSAPPSESGSADSSGGSDGGSAGGTVTGTAAQTRDGPVQVQLEVSGSEITHVSVLQYPDSDRRDLQISQSALPQLVQETVDAQSSDISMVSGATYTSEGYLQSLQSALDQAGL